MSSDMAALAVLDLVGQEFSINPLFPSTVPRRFPMLLAICLDLVASDRARHSRHFLHMMLTLECAVAEVGFLCIHMHLY